MCSSSQIKAAKGSTHDKSTSTDQNIDQVLKAQAKQHNVDYEWTYNEEPHATRRKMILKAHPEISKMFGHHWANKYIAVVTVVLLYATSVFASNLESWPAYPLLAYVVGGTCVHSLTLAIHELSHNLFFKSATHNQLFAMFCNWPLIFPYCVSFKKYHIDHHRYQGVDGVDVDIPSRLEAKFVTTPIRKFFWVVFQVLFYTFRPVIINPKKLSERDLLNMFSQIVADYTIYRLFGAGPILFCVLSLILGLGPHPCAGHFIAEHYTNIVNPSGASSPLKAGDEKQYLDETFSYRGPLNIVSYNVGYHVAHHDFPFVAGWNLPEIEKIAPEFYEHLPETISWPGSIYAYITGETNNPYNRVKRKTVKGDEGGKSD